MSAGAGDHEDEKKPMAMDQEGHINLKIKGQDGIEVSFRCKRNTPLKKLIVAYCDKQSKEMNTLAFLFDGKQFRGEQTPDELGMEEDAEIDAFMHAFGGGNVGYECNFLKG